MVDLEALGSDSSVTHNAPTPSTSHRISCELLALTQTPMTSPEDDDEVSVAEAVKPN